MSIPRLYCSDRRTLPRWLRPNGPRDRKYLGDDEQSPPAASRGSCQGEEAYFFADERPGKRTFGYGCGFVVYRGHVKLV